MPSVETLGILNDPDLLSAQTDILKRVAGLIKSVYATNKEILSKVGEANSLHDEAAKAADAMLPGETEDGRGSHLCGRARGIGRGLHLASAQVLGNAFHQLKEDAQA